MRRAKKKEENDESRFLTCDRRKISLSLSLSHVFSSIDPESIDANGKQLSNQSQTQPRHSLHPFVSSLELVIAFHKCHNVFLVFAKNKRRERENLVEREIATAFVWTAAKKNKG